MLRLSIADVADHIERFEAIYRRAVLDPADGGRRADPDPPPPSDRHPQPDRTLQGSPHKKGQRINARANSYSRQPDYQDQYTVSAHALPGVSCPKWEVAGRSERPSSHPW